MRRRIQLMCCLAFFSVTAWGILHWSAVVYSNRMKQTAENLMAQLAGEEVEEAYFKAMHNLR